MSAQRLTVQLLDAGDRAFLDALGHAGLMAELDEEELLRIASEVTGEVPDTRRTDLLELYYRAGGDEGVAARRRREDRFFIQRVGEPATAQSLVDRLGALTPELGVVALERIGGEDGPLVLRAGEHVSAVLDDYEEETDTDQFDLAEAQAKRRGVPMVTVRGLVRALNVLLNRHGVRERLVALRGDELREVYAAVAVTEGVALAQGGFLEDDDTEDLLELTGW